MKDNYNQGDLFIFVFSVYFSRMLLHLGGSRGKMGILLIRRVGLFCRSAHLSPQSLEYRPIKKVMVANRGKTCNPEMKYLANSEKTVERESLIPGLVLWKSKYTQAQECCILNKISASSKMIYLLLFTTLFTLFTILVLLFIRSLVISNLHANAWPHKMQVFSNFLMPCTSKYDDLYFIHPFSIIFYGASCCHCLVLWGTDSCGLVSGWTSSTVH